MILVRYYHYVGNRSLRLMSATLVEKAASPDLLPERLSDPGHLSIKTSVVVFGGRKVKKYGWAKLCPFQWVNFFFSHICHGDLIDMQVIVSFGKLVAQRQKNWTKNRPTWLQMIYNVFQNIIIAFGIRWGHLTTPASPDKSAHYHNNGQK